MRSGEGGHISAPRAECESPFRWSASTARLRRRSSGPGRSAPHSARLVCRSPRVPDSRPSKPTTQCQERARRDPPESIKTTARFWGLERCTSCGAPGRSPSVTVLVTCPGAPPVRLMADLGLHGVRRAKSPRTTRSASQGPNARLTWSGATSRRLLPTGCGSPTFPRKREVPLLWAYLLGGGCTSPSLPTFCGGSWVRRPLAGQCAPTWFWSL